MSRNKLIIILFLLAILSGFFWSSYEWGRPELGSDEPFYNTIAKNIIERGKFTLNLNGKEMSNAFEPMYPLFLSGVYLIFGVENFDAVRIIQIILFAFTVALIYLISEKLIGQKLALAVSFLMLMFFPLAANSGYLFREILFTFLVALSVYLMYKIREKPKLTNFILLGIVLGLATLTNGIIQFFIIFAVFYLIFLFRKSLSWKNLALKLLFLILFFLLTVGSWSMRDYFGSGDIQPVSRKNGAILGRKVDMMTNIRGERYLWHLGGQLFGYYFVENKDPSLTLEFIQGAASKKYYEMLEGGYGIEEVDSTLMRENLFAIAKDIPQFFAITFLDFLQFNGLMLPNTENLSASPGQNLFIKGSHPEIPNWLKVVILIVLRLMHWLFFGFVIYGLIKALKNPPDSSGGAGWQKWGWIILIIAYFNLAYSAIYGLARYAIPIYPFYIILFVYGAPLFFSRLKGLIRALN